jgi:MoaA/NifB/PqqE/SkfB family radical SAM enzyme
MSDDLVKRLRMVTGFIRFETGDRIAASVCLSEEAADRIEELEAKLVRSVDSDVAALEKILNGRGRVFDAMVEAAEDAAERDVSFNVVVGRALRAALKELKGEKND